MTQHLLAFSNPLIDPYITWDTVTWLKSVTNLPVVVKGILSGHCYICFRLVMRAYAMF